MKKVNIFSLAVILVASQAIAEPTVSNQLQEELSQYDMTAPELGQWMQSVIEMRGYACSHVDHMSGQVPKTEAANRRNVAISVTCEENTYFITVGIGVGWEVQD